MHSRPYYQHHSQSPKPAVYTGALWGWTHVQCVRTCHTEHSYCPKAPCALLFIPMPTSGFLSDCHVVEIIQYVALSYWLLFLINMHLFPFPCVFLWRESSFLFVLNNILLSVTTAVYWRRKWHPTPVLLPGKFHGWRSLVGYNPSGCKESDSTE